MAYLMESKIDRWIKILCRITFRLLTYSIKRAVSKKGLAQSAAGLETVAAEMRNEL
jgi:hypothetical protein